MKRKGFTLIELMVVIAIIIILAAVAIPNYINMTKRAKRSRVMSDMATLATGLEAFRTDWGTYPIITTAEAVSDTSTQIYAELTGSGTGTAVTNVAGAINSAGETGPTNYIKAETLGAIKNPFSAVSAGVEAWPVSYLSSSTGNHFGLYAQQNSDATGGFIVRTDKDSAAVDADAAPTIAD